MTVTPELLVFQHLKAHCSPKIVEKFCKEANFNPTEKNHESAVSIGEIFKSYQENMKKRKAPENSEGSEDSDSDSSSSEEEEDEDLTKNTIKKQKIDWETTECYNCKKTGHMSRQCPEKMAAEKAALADESSDNVCFKCNKPGHFSRECPEKAGDNPCFNCNKTGHFSRECPDKHADMSCYNCGKNGHLSRDCPDKATGMKCYNCGESGHLSRECSKKDGANSKMLCYNCQNTGHLARDCDQPSQPRKDRGGRFSGGNRGGYNRQFASGANNLPLGAKKA